MATLPKTRRVLRNGLADAIASGAGQDVNSISSVSESSSRSGLTLKQVHIRWLITLAVACGAIIVFFPFFWMAVTSLKTAPEIQRVPLQIAPDNWFHLSNYVEVFKREPFLRYLLNSAIVASIAAVSSVVVSSLAGFGFAKYYFPGRDVFFLAVVGIMMVPFQSVVVPLYVWMNELGLLDTYMGIVAPDLVSVFGVFLMRQAIETIPNDYIDAARIDGCSELRIFFSVILPSVKPAIATLLIIKFMWSWNEFFWPMVVISSPQMKVATMGLMSFTNMYFIEYNLLTAAAVISIMPILLIFITLQRWVVQGVVMSGLKG
jgi:multiple sugar transport system permease protein